MNTETETETQTNIESLFIEARCWFDKTYGNTYHSVRLTANGLPIGQVGFTYGYGQMWQYTALEYLKKFGLVDDAVKYWYQMPKSWTIYTAETYGKKNEMFKELTTEQNFSNLLHIEELKKGN